MELTCIVFSQVTKLRFCLHMVFLQSDWLENSPHQMTPRGSLKVESDVKPEIPTHSQISRGDSPFLSAKAHKADGDTLLLLLCAWCFLSQPVKWADS